MLLFHIDFRYDIDTNDILAPTGANNVQTTDRRSRYGRHGPQPRAQH